MPLRGHTLAFDLDGTLVDTAPDLVRALNVCMQGSGLVPTRIEQVRAIIGQGARALIERAFSLGGITPTPDDVDKRLTHFLDDYAANIAQDSRVFDGVTGVLSALTNAGARLTICTNKAEVLTKKLLDAVELKQYFDAVVCPENVSAKKPDPAHLLRAIHPSSAAQAIMVGDSAADLQSARAANVPIILMSYGYSQPSATELGADIVLDHFNQIPDAVFTLLARKKP